MLNVNTVGLAAGALTTFSFVPQAVKVWRTRDTRAISLWMFVIFCAGVLLWAIYGVLIGSIPVIAANVVTLVLALTILAFKLRYK